MSSSRLSNLSTIVAFQFNVTTAGTAEQLGAKRRATTIAFVNNGSARDTITDSGNGFITAGLRAGDVVTISGATNGGNNSTFTVYSVAAGTITITRNNVLTTESAGATVVIVGDKRVPEGVAVVVKAKNGNTGNVFISDVAAGATSGAGFILRNNESVTLLVNDTNSIWLDVGTSGEGVEVLFERNVQGS